MAAANSISEKRETADSGPTKGQLIIALCLVTLIAAAAGAFQGMQLSRTDANGLQSAETAKTPNEAASQIFDLPPVVTNIGSPSDTWVRLEASIVVDPKIVAHPEALSAKIADDFLSYLRTVTLAEIQGPIGLEGLRQALADRAATRSQGAVKDLVLRTLVVQ